MIVASRLRGVLALGAALLLGLAGGVAASTRKGDKLLKQARLAEQRNDFDAAILLYDQTLKQDPADASYLAGARRVHFEGGQAHVEKGQQLRQQGQLEEALAEYQRGFSIDPSSAIALEGIRVTTGMVDKAKAAQGGEKQLTPAEKARKELEERIGSLKSVPVLKPINAQISSLKMNNQPPKVLYETVGKLAGINVIFDPAYQQNSGGGRGTANLDLTNSTLEDALDSIAMLTHTFWKPLSSNTIFVAEENPTKRRDYDDNVVKVFYLQNVTSPQEFVEIVTAVRSVTDIRRMFTYTAQSAVMARGTADQIALAEKLFHDLDKPKAEVLVDIMVISTSGDRARTLGMGLDTSGIALPIAFTPRASIANPAATPAAGAAPAPSTSIPLSRIGQVNFRDYSTVLPGALLNAILTDSTSNVLESPQVRASDGMKVTLKVGQKYPYATGSFQPGIGIGGTGMSPLVSTQFQFLDTGLDMEVTPHVHGTDEVTLHVDITVSSVQGNVNLGGLSQPIVAQQKDSTDLRLRDGQVTLMGGLMATTDTFNVTGIPGIVNIPILGNLLGASNKKERVHNELVIALIPHILRTPNMQDVDFRGVAAGTEQLIRVSYDKPVAPSPTPTPASAPMTAPAPSAAPMPAAPAAARLMQGRLVAFPGEMKGQLNGAMIVNLRAENFTDLFSAPIRLKWDPKLLKLTGVEAGPLLSEAGGKGSAPADIRNQAGEATLNFSRPPGAGGVSGSGSLGTLTFVGVGQGAGSVEVVEFKPVNSRMEPLPASVQPIRVTVE